MQLKSIFACQPSDRQACLVLDEFSGIPISAVWHKAKTSQNEGWFFIPGEFFPENQILKYTLEDGPDLQWIGLDEINYRKSNGRKS